MKTPADIDVRRRAATDFGQNLVVLAGAGTGKTSLLVERVLNAVGSGEVGLEALAAITFTEKAAGEMRQRLSEGLNRLRALARGEVEHDPAEGADRAFEWLTASIAAETVAERALAAMEALDRARVSTIHAFCSEVLREYPIAAGVDPDFSVDSGGNAGAQRMEAWERFLSRELGPNAERAELWHRALEAFPMAELRQIAFALSGFEIPLELLDEPRTPPADEVLSPVAARLKRAIDDLRSRQTGMTARTETWLDEMSQALALFAKTGVESFRLSVEASRELPGRIKRNTPNFTTKIENVTKTEFDDAVWAAANFAKSVDEIDDERLLLALEATAPFAREFRDELLRQGIVDFDGLIGLTRDLLRDRPDVRRSIKQRFRMLLVDEFQDTDPLQHEIVLLLGERVEDNAASPYATRLGEGRLFVVGDAKQSIYRFRGADYASYRRAVEHIVGNGGAELTLTANFRSLPGIVDSVNALFCGTPAWEPSDYQPDYVAIEPFRDDRGDGPVTDLSAVALAEVELWTIDADDIKLAEHRREAEGRVLAEAIETAVAKGSCGYHDIHVLFRSFSSISYYLRPLRQRGIPFVVDGGRDFLDRPEVAQLMGALRALALPGDQPALLAFLRSPAGAVSDVELAEYAAGRGAWDWRREPDPASHARIADRFALLRALRDETRWLPADAVIRRVLDRTHMLPLGAAAFEGAQRVANLRKLAESAAELAHDGRLSLAEVVQALEDGLLEDIETDRPLSDDAAEAVRITSIHRMKGLENAWIFLPDLARQEARGRNDTYGAKVLRLPDGRDALALQTDSGCNGVSVLHGIEHAEHERAEETRVNYVALTRARNRLIGMVGPARSQTRWITALKGWGFDADVRPADGETIGDGRVLHRRFEPSARPRLAVVKPPAPVDAAVERWDAVVQTLVAAAEPPLATPSGLEPDAGDERGAGPARGAGAGRRDLGRATGIVVHRLLEQLGSAVADAATRSVTLERLCRETADAEDVDLAALRDETGALIETFATSELAERLGSIEVLGREVPMLSRHGDGRTFRGNIDLLYRDAAGNVTVADYKTDRDEDEDALRERYGGQLASYASAVAGALGLAATPRAELWLLRSGKRLTLER